MSNDDFDVFMGQGQIRSFDNDTKNDANRFQQGKIRRVASDIQSIRGQLYVRPAIDASIMDSNRVQRQVRPVSANVIDSAIDQAQDKPTQTEATESAKNKGQFRSMDAEFKQMRQNNKPIYTDKLHNIGSLDSMAKMFFKLLYQQQHQR